MQSLRTPDSAFENLSEYDFEPHYVDVGSAAIRARMHYVDIGSGTTVLLLHGQPSWSYLYRKVIRELKGAPIRIVAPDLIGFGKSDKPARIEDFSYARHSEWLESFVSALGLKDIVLYCQDWGGLLGLRLAGQRPELFQAIVAANTGLPTGHQTMPAVWYEFKKFCIEAKRLPFGRMIAQGCARPMTAEAKAAYAAPYPDDSYAMGPRSFPGLIPLTPSDPEGKINQAALKNLRKFNRPFLTAFSDSDPITAGGDVILQRFIAGAKSRNDHMTIAKAGHFLQEDAPEGVADSIRRALAAVEQK